MRPSGSPVYPSRVDAWLVLVVAFALGATLYGGFTASSSDSQDAYGAFFAAGVMVALLAGLAVPCRYVLEHDHLLIRSGLLFRQRIMYRDITAVETSANPFAAPALSLRRVKVTFGGKYQLVSPAAARTWDEPPAARGPLTSGRVESQARSEYPLVPEPGWSVLFIHTGTNGSAVRSRRRRDGERRGA